MADDLAPYSGGWLHKKKGTGSSWKRRWCVLQGRYLYYYEDPSKQPLGKIPLNDANCVPVAGSGGNKWKFRIEPATKVRPTTLLVDN